MPIQRLAKVSIAVLLFVLYTLVLIHPVRLVTDDLGRHIKNGEIILDGQSEVLGTNFYSYTEGDGPFVNHHWFSGVILYFAQHAFGWEGLVIFKVAVYLAAFALLFFVALKSSNFWLVSLLAVPVILLLRERTDVRPEMFSYLFFALFVYALDRFKRHPEDKRVFWLIPLQALWANMHIFFPLGPIIVGSFLVERMVHDRFKLKGNKEVRVLSLLFFGVLMACMMNPHGIRGALYPATIFNNYAFDVSENHTLIHFFQTEAPTDISLRLFIPLAIILFISLAIAWRKKPIFYALLTLLFVAIGFKMVRGVALLGLLFLPAVSFSLGDTFESAQQRYGRFKPLFVAALAASLVALIFFRMDLTISSERPFGLGLEPYTNGSAEFFKAHNLHGPIFNDYDIGSYLVYHLFPEEKVFVDNRPEAYSTSFFEETYLPMLESEGVWQDALGKYRFNVIFFYQYDDSPYGRRFLYRRMNDPAWVLVYADTQTVILVRNVEANAEVIRTSAITRANAASRLKPLADAPDYNAQVAAADLFNLMNREDLGIAQFKSIVKTWPDKGRVWLIMGEWAVKQRNLSDLSSAPGFLEKAIEFGERTAEAYSFLGLAYYKLGEEEKAEEALVKSLAINPSRQDALELLENIRKARRF